MKTLYLECGMGAAGDMLTAALLELTDDPKEFTDKINSLKLKDVSVSSVPVIKQGIRGTQMSVKISGTEEESEDVNTGGHNHREHGHDEHEEHHHHGHSHDEHEEHHHHGHGEHEEHHHHEHSHHSHTTVKDIENTVAELNVSEKVKKDINAVYGIIAEAESFVHGKRTDEIHFHEVGTMDALADIAGVCILMEMLAPERVIVSPVNLGSGHVRCMHGILPVPAPATAHIMRDVPVYSGRVEGELCTPTGAALLKYFADEFGSMPVMKVSRTGYGMGKKDFPVLNCVRSFYGETAETSDSITELVCNLDDMTGEAIGAAQEILLREGACDVFTVPAGMKKNRPAVILTCLCHEEQRDRMVQLLFRHTSTLGIRESVCRRYTLGRRSEAVSTSLGEIRIKYSEGYGVRRFKAEYDDAVKAAEENGISFDEAVRIIEKEICQK